MKFASLVVVVSAVARVARPLASLVKTVVVVRHFRWHLSTRIFLPGKKRLDVCHCEHRPKIMLDARKTGTATVMVVAVVRVAD